ncbi:MAG TPA: hypothetical protein VI588_02065 [Candidatus Gracilibacteria bacterium]|nr:hypothetical protein [Candidatus Gracilibacteria bacterium]
MEGLKRRGYEAVYLKYPVYDLVPTGPELNTILRSTAPQPLSEAQLQTLFARNRRDYEPTLVKMLDEGKIVVAEDYTGTGIAWGMAKGLDRQTLEKINEGLLREDLPMLIVGERTLAAREKKHIHESDDALVEKVDHTLRELSKDKGWHIIELQKKLEATAALIWTEVENFIKTLR